MITIMHEIRPYYGGRNHAYGTCDPAEPGTENSFGAAGGGRGGRGPPGGGGGDGRGRGRAGRPPSRPAWWREPRLCCWPPRGWKINRLHDAWASCRKQQRGGGDAFWKAASQLSIRMRRDRASRAPSPTVR